jgi:hypothetical protein
VHLSRTQIVLYLGLIAGVIAGLAYGLPQWQLITLGLIVGIVDIVTSRGKPPPRAAAVWPWQRPAFWAVLALLVALAIALRYLDAPVGIVVLICSLGLVPYGFQLGGEIARKRRQLSGRIPRPSGTEDWAIFIGSIALCVLGLLLVRQDWRTAIVTSTFFGACALTLFTVIYRKRRERRWRASVVRVTGGVDIPVSASRFGFIALGCFVVGAVMFFVGVNYPLLMRLLGAFIGLVGVALAIALACGYFTRQVIRFDPDAFTVGERGFRCRIAWDDIAEVAEFEFARNPFVGVWLRDLEAVIVEPANRFDSFLSRVANDRALMSADVVIAPRNFGIDGPALAAALKRYAIDRSARAELVARERLAAPGASK